MNNKADVTVTMLVIGVFAVCTLALISFYQSSVEVRNSLVGFNLMEKMNSDLESLHFTQKDSLKNIPVIRTDAGGDYLLEEKIETTGWFPWTKRTKTVFSLKYYLK